MGFSNGMYMVSGGFGELGGSGIAEESCRI